MREDHDPELVEVICEGCDMSQRNRESDTFGIFAVGCRYCGHIYGFYKENGHRRSDGHSHKQGESPAIVSEPSRAPCAARVILTAKNEQCKGDEDNND